ncbi:MAG: hypothetical protein PHH16_03490 [Candidatus Gracilibacteria bacterium]|nr:hypothetical protein [Candidatus Gracilibacteria bacterium]
MLQENLKFGQSEEKVAQGPDLNPDAPISVEEIIDLIVAEEQKVLSSNGQSVFEGM